MYRGGGDFSRVGIKKLTQKTHPKKPTQKNPKKIHLKKLTKNVFLGFLGFF